ncbi:MAG: SEC-C metal-binding domain-containing protein [Cycloclasticus sp.]
MDVLDKRQTELIESVHRGFLYQHLYAVGCLLLASSAKVSSVVVEHDEDIEIVSGNRTYIQVKTRSMPIIPSDIDGALKRFNDLRAEHDTDQRIGHASFLIVVNQPPGPKLAKLINGEEWPLDTKLLWPKSDQMHPSSAYPPAWDSINEAFDWCISQAEKLPFSLISPDSLVWKLAGRVMMACTGSTLNPNHAFQTDDLPELFEQLLLQLQEFPSPPNPYRPQTNEPPLEMASPVRIVCGFSGAGKTAWASEAARHTSETVTYYDVGELPGPALATSLVRELAPRLMEERSGAIRKVLYPGATGIESLNILNTHIKNQGRQPIIVLDNAHRIPVENLSAVIEVAGNIRFILLCQPSSELRIIEAKLGVDREVLSGWDLDTVAIVAQANGCKGSIAALNKLIKLTGGVPLYVQSSVVLSARETEGDLDVFCNELETLTHTAETVQEIILNRLYESFPTATQNVLAVLSLSDEALYHSEVIELVEGALNVGPPVIIETLRKLRASGIIEVFGGDRLKVHDAIRIIGRRTLVMMGDDAVLKSQGSLKDVLMKSLIEKQDTSRLSLFIRTLVALEEVELLVELAGDEYFHEMGLSDDIKACLKPIADSSKAHPKQRFWALDGLSFDATHHGRMHTIGTYLDQMEQLIEQHKLGTDEKLSYFMKRMLYEATQGDADKVLTLIDTAFSELPENPAYMRVFKYNSAASLIELGYQKEPLEILDALISEYFDLIGIKFVEMRGNNSPVLLEKLNKYPELHEDLKRLATALTLRADYSPQILMANTRIQCMKLYEMAQAYDSFIKTAQNLADDFVAQQDFIGAKEVMDQHIIPNISKLGLINRLFDVRCQYAVILAYCGEFEESEKEMTRLDPLIAGQSTEFQKQIASQRRLINEIRIKALPLRSTTKLNKKIGRNEPCPCNSGKKYKKCHGY